MEILSLLDCTGAVTEAVVFRDAAKLSGDFNSNVDIGYILQKEYIYYGNFFVLIELLLHIFQHDNMSMHFLSLFYM